MGNFESESSFSPEERVERSEEQREFAERLENIDFIFPSELLNLALTSERVKPASEAALWKDAAESNEAFQEKVDVVTKILEDRGLSFDPNRGTIEGRDGTPIEFVEFAIGRSKDELQKAIDARKINNYDERQIAYGNAYGYPETAVQAKPDEIINWYELPDDIMFNEEIDSSPFTMSKENWNEEIEVARDWGETAKEATPALYERAILSGLRTRIQTLIEEKPEEMRKILHSEKAMLGLEKRSSALHDNVIMGAKAHGLY